MNSVQTYRYTATILNDKNHLIKKCTDNDLKKLIARVLSSSEIGFNAVRCQIIDNFTGHCVQQLKKASYE